MALDGQIADLKQESLAALDAVYDYYAHTRLAWRLVQQVVREGRTFTIHNRITGSAVPEQEFVTLGQEYVTRHLTSATFQQIVSLIEDFMFDILRLWLIEYPGGLSGKQLDFRTVLECRDKDEIVRTVAEKELSSLRYESVPSWFRYLEKTAALGCPTQEQVERLAEIKATRDVLVHNKGVANRIYIRKSMGHARYGEGDKVGIPKNYYRDSWRLVKKLVADIADAAIAKLRT